MRIFDIAPAGTFGGNFFAGERAGSFALTRNGTNTNSASRNIGIGVDAMSQLTVGFNNIAIGAASGAQMTSAHDNTFVGTSAGYKTATGAHNTAMGLQAFYNNVGGSHNTAIGRDALFSNTSGNWNTSCGVDANPGNTTGVGNTAVGGESGYTDNLANQNVTGSNNTWIGYQTGSTDPTQHDNCIAIGYRAKNDADNQTVIGNANTAQTRVFGDLSANASVTANRDGRIIAGGDTGSYLAISKAGVRIYEGSGAPTIEAPQGSLYIRTDATDAALYTNVGGERWATYLSAVPAAAQADSTTTEVAGVTRDFNTLLAKLRTAGLLAI